MIGIMVINLFLHAGAKAEPQTLNDCHQTIKK